MDRAGGLSPPAGPKQSKAKGGSAKDPAGAAQGSSGAANAESAHDPGVKRKPGIFTRELRSMMYGFGDDPEPLPESVELMEDIVVEYLTEIVHLAQDLPGRKGKVSVEDVLFLVRKDPRKYARAKELLVMNERIKNDRKQLQEDATLTEGFKERE